MLNWFAKALLVATALSPMLGAVAINQIANGRPWSQWTPWLVSAICFAVLCWLVLHYAARHGEKYTFQIKEFEDKDKEVLAFLLTYFLPFLATEKLEFKGEWMTGVYIMAIIILTIVHAGAFHFNPVMGLFYHFYSVKDSCGASNLLISRKPLRKAGEEIETVRLAYNIYLERGKNDAQ
jgi:MFS family permease